MCVIYVVLCHFSCFICIITYLYKLTAINYLYLYLYFMVYQQIVGIPMIPNYAPLIADVFLFRYERDLMSNLHKSKQYDLIDMFNDTSRYLGRYIHHR